MVESLRITIIHKDGHGGGLVTKSCPTLLTPWTVAHQASLSMEFSRQEYWSGSPCPPPGDLSDSEIKPGLLHWASNPGLLHCRWIFYHLSHQRSPKILEWIAYPFSRGSSQPRSRTRVSHIAGRFFTSWATREALLLTTDPNEKKPPGIVAIPLWGTLLLRCFHLGILL